MTEEQLDQALAKQCTNFNIETYGKLQLAYKLLESIKERGLHIKEEVTEKVEHMKEGGTEKVEHMRERSREMKERAKETAAEVKGAAEFTAKEVTERVKANATLHAAED